MKYKQGFFDNKVVDNLLSEKIFTWPCKVSFSDINIALLNLFNNENKIAALSLNIF